MNTMNDIQRPNRNQKQQSSRMTASSQLNQLCLKIKRFVEFDSHLISIKTMTA